MPNDPRPLDSDAESRPLDDVDRVEASESDRGNGDQGEFRAGQRAALNGERVRRRWVTAASILIPIAIIIWFLSDFFLEPHARLRLFSCPQLRTAITTHSAKTCAVPWRIEYPAPRSTCKRGARATTRAS